MATPPHGDSVGASPRRETPQGGEQEGKSAAIDADDSAVQEEKGGSDEHEEEEDGDGDGDDAVDAVEEDAVRASPSLPVVADSPTDPAVSAQCCICQEFVNVLAQGFLPTCDHRFHFDCIVSWAKVTNLCPLCRAKFNLVTRVDAGGRVVHRERVTDVTQVFRPDPQDHDIAAQLRLVSEARCETCGSGEDEHVLLMCDAPGCAVANHTYCVGLRDVPETAWYCARHAGGTRVASDLIARRATTVSTRRRTRRLATLMSNVLSGGRTENRNAASRTTRRRRTRTAGGPDGATGTTEGRPIRGVAAGYALRMSRELEVVQRRADAMFARGDLTETALHQYPGHNNGGGASRSTGTRSTSTMSSGIEQMWEDHDRSRRELAGAVEEEEEDTSVGGAGKSGSSQISKTLVPEFRALEKLMADAVSHDNYASSVSLLIPKTAKLRLVSRVKAFFGKLNDREAHKLLSLGCLSIVHQWVREPERDPPNPQVLDAVLGVLETLPIKKDHLEEEKTFVETIDQLARLQGVAYDNLERLKAIQKRWLKLIPPPSTRNPTQAQTNWRQQQQVIQARESTESSSQLPEITAFTVHRANGKRKRQQEGWVEPAVDYVKAKLYPLYKDSGVNGSPQLSKERFKSIVKQVTHLFTSEAAAFQSPVVSTAGELSSLAKDRLKKLIDQVYKASRGKSHRSAIALPSPGGFSAAAAGYSSAPAKRPR